MCLNPVKINDVEVPCQQCWQCKQNRVRDWVGRCIAETKTSARSTVMTLTYGQSPKLDASDNDWHATRLVYDDVKKYLKLLRYHGYPVRYFAVGENGSRKGRAHWHIILFWQSDKMPKLNFGVRFDHKPFWPHGFAWAENADAAAIRYCMKYITKTFEDGMRTAYGLSRRPPLGANYFRTLALLHVEHGLSPQDLRYSFPDVLKRDGSKMEFFLKRHSAYFYLNAFDEEWQLRYHNQDWPQSDLMDLYVDIRERKARRAAGQPDIDNDVFFDYYFNDSVSGIKKHFSGEKPKWQLNPDVAAIAVERLIAESQNQYLTRKKVG